MPKSMSRLEHLPKDATETTKTANAELLHRLPFADQQDLEDATQGFLAPLPDGGILKNEHGQVVWDMARYSFIKLGAAAPGSIVSHFILAC